MIDETIFQEVGPLIERLALDEAVSMVRKRVLDDPTNPDRMTELGIVLIQVRRAREAIETLKKAESYEPDNPDILGYLGQAHYFNGDHQDAREAIQRSLAQDPRNIPALNGLGMLETEEGHYADAEQALTKIIEDLGPVTRILTERAYVRYKLGRYDEGIDDCTLALEQEPNLVALQSRATLYDAIGRPDLADADRTTLLSYHNAASLIDLVQQKEPRK